jgi:hypothetical protein
VCCLTPRPTPQLTCLQNQLKPEIFEALQILKDGYCTRVLSAIAEADFYGKDIWNDEEMI